MSPPKRPDDWRTFGWHGITLRVPKGWDLGKVTGNARSGYVRLDDLEIARVEVEWRSDPPPRPVSQIVDRYLANLEREASRKATAFDVQRHLHLVKDEEALKGHEYECFRWRADYQAYNLARRCGDCGRLVLVRIFAKRNERLEDVIRSVLASLGDHPEKGMNTWAIYDLMCYVPEEFGLLESGLKSGDIRLTFQDPAAKKTDHTLEVEYVSLASVLLSQASLIEWFESFFAKSLKDFEITHQEQAIQGHSGVEVRGRPKPRWRQLLKPMPFLSPRPRRHMKARAWHCEESNKIYVIRAYSKNPSDGLLEVIPIEVVCHQAKAASKPRGHAELSARPQ